VPDVGVLDGVLDVPFDEDPEEVPLDVGDAPPDAEVAPLDAEDPLVDGGVEALDADAQALGNTVVLPSVTASESAD